MFLNNKKFKRYLLIGIFLGFLVCVSCSEALTENNFRKDRNGISQKYEAIVQKDPYNLKLHQEFIEIFIKDRKTSQIKSFYINKIASEPLNFAFHYALGYIYTKEENFDEAIIELQRSIELNSNQKLAHGALGRCYKNKGEIDKAIEEYRKVINIDANDEIALKNLGFLYIKQGKYNEAISWNLKALRLNPNDAKIYYNLGLSYQQMDQLDKTIENYKKAIELSPSYTEAHYNLGVAYLAREEYDFAIEEFEKVLQLGADEINIHYFLGEAYKGKGLLDIALKEYKKELKINPNDIESQNEARHIYYIVAKLVIISIVYPLIAVFTLILSIFCIKKIRKTKFENEDYFIKWSVADIAIIIVSFCILSPLLSLIAGKIIHNSYFGFFTRQPLNLNLENIFGFIRDGLFFGVLPIYFVIKKYKGKIQDLGMKLYRPIWSLYWGIGGGFLLSVLDISVLFILFHKVFGLIDILPTYSIKYMTTSDIYRGNLFLVLLNIGVISPFAQEIFFRGFVYPVIKKHTGIIWGVLLSSAFFAFVHFVSKPIIILYLISGVVFAFLYEHTKSLFAPIIAHIISNTITILIWRDLYTLFSPIMGN